MKILISDSSCVLILQLASYICMFVCTDLWACGSLFKPDASKQCETAPIWAGNLSISPPWLDVSGLISLFALSSSACHSVSVSIWTCGQGSPTAQKQPYFSLWKIHLSPLSLVLSLAFYCVCPCSNCNSNISFYLYSSRKLADTECG